MPDVTQILSAIEQGDPSAAEQLLPLVYGELRKLAADRMALRRIFYAVEAFEDRRRTVHAAAFQWEKVVSPDGFEPSTL